MLVCRRAQCRDRVVALEDVQDLAHRHAAGAGRRHRVDRVAAIRQLDRRAPFGAIGAQIILRDQSTAALHLGHDQIGDLPAVEDVGTGIADELQRAREVVLLPQRTRHRGAVVREELRATRRELGEQLPVVRDVVAARAVHDMAIREPDRGSKQRGPRERAEALPRRVQAGDATGDTRGEMPDEALVGHVPGGIQIHVVCRTGGRGFAIVEREHLARGAAMHDESAATDVAGVREHDFERERDGDGSVDRIAPLLQNLHSGLGRERMSRHDHRMLPGRGFRPKRPRRWNRARAANDDGMRGKKFGRWVFGRARDAAGQGERRNEEDEDLLHFLIWKLTQAAVNV